MQFLLGKQPTMQNPFQMRPFHATVRLINLPVQLAELLVFVPIVVETLLAAVAESRRTVTFHALRLAAAEQFFAGFDRRDDFSIALEGWALGRMNDRFVGRLPGRNYRLQ